MTASTITRTSLGYTCTRTSLGYTWEGQIEFNGKKSSPIKLSQKWGNIIKISHYIPGISIITGLFHIALAVNVLCTKKNTNLQKLDLILAGLRGVIATLQLGALLFIADVVVTVAGLAIKAGVDAYNRNHQKAPTT